MRDQDAETAAISVRLSLEQLIDTATGKLNFDYEFNNKLVEAVPDSFSSCNNNYMPNRKADPAIIDPCVKILVTTPIPGLATGLGELPRFR